MRKTDDVPVGLRPCPKAWYATTMTVAAEWPAHFPADCPPPDAADLSGTVFLLVAGNPPTAKDTECAIDRDSHRNSPECRRASISCARESSHLLELKQSVKRLREHLVASATMKAEHGKIKQTGPAGHFSIWLRAKYLGQAHTYFTIVASP